MQINPSQSPCRCSPRAITHVTHGRSFFFVTLAALFCMLSREEDEKKKRLYGRVLTQKSAFSSYANQLGALARLKTAQRCAHGVRVNACLRTRIEHIRRGAQWRAKEKSRKKCVLIIVGTRRSAAERGRAKYDRVRLRISHNIMRAYRQMMRDDERIAAFFCGLHMGASCFFLGLFARRVYNMSCSDVCFTNVEIIFEFNSHAALKNMQTKSPQRISRIIRQKKSRKKQHRRSMCTLHCCRSARNARYMHVRMARLVFAFQS